MGAGIDMGSDEIDNCASFATIEVTTDKTVYAPLETVTGHIVFTNNSGASMYVNGAGNIYDGNENLIYTNSGSVTMATGVNTFNLSNLFGNLQIPSNASGNYTFEVLGSTSGITCIWSDTAVITVVP